MSATSETTTENLVDRLRGIFTIPVDDGAGLLDGKNTFTRNFETSPIMHKAADEIERLRAQLAEVTKLRDEAVSDLHSFRTTYELFPDQRDKVKNLRAELTAALAKVAEMREVLQYVLDENSRMFREAAEIGYSEFQLPVSRIERIRKALSSTPASENKQSN